MRKQMRGHCQLCGHEQAVRGAIAKHGYTVEYGYFNGVCHGHMHEPIETDRAFADKVCADVLADCARLDKYAADVRAGIVKPENAKTGKLVFEKNRRVDVMVPFDQAAEYYKEVAINSAICNAENRARNGRGFVNGLQAVVETFHGKPLREVVIEDGPAPINAGEKRLAGQDKKLLVAIRAEGGRVIYKNDRGFRGWVGIQAWRKMELAP